MTTAHPIPDAALAQHIAILGKTGSGKTYAAKGVVERLLDRGERVCIVDPTGVYRGLRSNAAGDGPGYPVVVFGGRHGDLPLTSDQGAEIAGIVGTTTTPIVLDTLLMGVGERTRFFAAFAEALLPANRGPLHLIIDEAHLFAPQGRVADPQSSMMVHAANNLVSLGRARGLRITLITQRPAKLHKDSLTQVETLVAMRLIAPQDRKAVEDWIAGQGDRAASEVMSSLASLPQGEGWVWAPELGVLERVRFPAIRTFDTGRPGTDDEDLVLAPIDVAAIRSALSVSHASNEGKKSDTRRAQPSDVEIAAAERRGYERGLEEGLRRGGLEGSAQVAELSAVLARLAEATRQKAAALREGRWALSQPAERDLTQDEKDARTSALADARRRETEARTPTVAAGNTGLNSAARKMLAVLDTNPPVRRSWVQVATLAGLKARGGHFNAGKKALLDGGLVLVEADLVRIASPSASARPEAIDAAALVEMWAGNLAGAAPRILRYLHQSGGEASRITTAADLGLQPRGGHWNAAWKELRDNTLIVETGDGVRLADLFTEHGHG